MFEKQIELLCGDSAFLLQLLPSGSVDAIVTDPPYGLSFMGKKWDYDVPSVEVWAECLRVLKPGGHLLAFAGTRTQHRMAVRIEDAGFEIRDMIAWVYGSGFPKSRDISKDIDYRGGAQLAWFGPWLREWREKRGISQSELAKHFPSRSGGKTGRVSNFERGVRLPTADDFNLLCRVLDLPFKNIEEAEREVIGTMPGDPERFKSFAEQDGNERRTFNNDITAPATEAARQWQGWGTALKPALEPITVARKPLIGTVAENVLAHGTGGLNIDGCRVGETVETWPKSRSYGGGTEYAFTHTSGGVINSQPTGAIPSGRWPANLIHDGSDEVLGVFPSEKAGSASRYFYCAKTSKRDRNEGCEHIEAKQYSHDGRETSIDNAYQRNSSSGNNHHPTVKPTDLMRYLCRLVTPPGGVVLDPFMGSGSTGKAAMLEGFRFIGIEREAEYLEIAKARIESVNKAQPIVVQQPVNLDLFDGAA
jgi:DNA modification methylase/transcriptional regulator with XRE-family HTH domain